MSVSNWKVICSMWWMQRVPGDKRNVNSTCHKMLGFQLLYATLFWKNIFRICMHCYYPLPLDGWGWLRGSSMGVCEALCDIACKKGYTITFDLMLMFDPCVLQQRLALVRRWRVFWVQSVWLWLARSLDTSPIRRRSSVSRTEVVSCGFELAWYPQCAC